MKKENQVWKISDLQSAYKNIEFPEFQREPTVWRLDKKQLLIDSIFRGLDISTIYLVKLETDDSVEADVQEHYECIDGRQRINAMLSYLGLNESDDPSGPLDNKFAFKSTNELHPKEILETLDGRTFEDLRDDKTSNWDDIILNYEFNVLEISEVPKDEDDELNLMFLRLQGGSGLNPGEKLRAMRGRMRDLIFGVSDENKKVTTAPESEEFEEVPQWQVEGLGKHEFFNYLAIPKRRYAREQVAVQVAMNFFSQKEKKEFQRARFLDLQEFLGDHVERNDGDEGIIADLKARLDKVYEEFSKDKNLRLKNRAIGVSTFFFVSKLIDNQLENEIPKFVKFLDVFLPTLKEQVEKGIDIDPHFRDLLKFQTYISQAAVEKYAIENRQAFLEEYFTYYCENNGKIKTVSESK